MLRDYATSVRRLVRDGVDAPLATLFVTAARPMPQDIEGTNRARECQRGVSLSTSADVTGDARTLSGQCGSADCVRRLGQDGSRFVMRGFRASSSKSMAVNI